MNFLHISRLGTCCRGWQELPPGLATPSQFFLKVGSKALYTYDQGDNWEHEVKLVIRLSAAEQTPVPSCTDGNLAGPLEDCGGAPRVHFEVGDVNRLPPLRH